MPGVKKAGEVCHHLCSAGYGCRIYADRPLLCSNYRCAWLQGRGAEEDRPDLSGVLVESRDTQFGWSLVAKAASPGGTDNLDAIRRLAGDFVCLVVDEKREGKISRIEGKPRRVKKFKRLHGIS